MRSFRKRSRGLLWLIALELLTSRSTPRNRLLRANHEEGLQRARRALITARLARAQAPEPRGTENPTSKNSDEWDVSRRKRRSQRAGKA